MNGRVVRTIRLLTLVALLPGLVWASGDLGIPNARSFDFEYDTIIKTLPQGAHELRLWIPAPQSGLSQQISNLRIESPVPYTLHHEPKYGNQYAYLSITPGKVHFPIEVRMHFTATRRENRVDVNDPPASATVKTPVSSAELTRWLKPDQLVPIDGLIGQLSRQQTEGLTTSFAKARAIYKYVEANMRYDKSGTGWGRGDALFACDAHRGNCTDFHSLFIGMARAADIPARFEIGFPLPPNQDEGEIAGYHCWAEFYLQGVGWVPIDASEAWQNPARRSYYFGALDPNRVQFTIGRDITLNPRQKGEPLNYFVYPYAELDGKPFADVEHKFSFHDIRNVAQAEE